MPLLDESFPKSQILGSIWAVACREHRSKLFELGHQFVLLLFEVLPLEFLLPQLAAEGCGLAEDDDLGRALLISRRRYLLLQFVEEILEADAPQALHVVVHRPAFYLWGLGF